MVADCGIAQVESCSITWSKMLEQKVGAGSGRHAGTQTGTQASPQFFQMEQVRSIFTPQLCRASAKLAKRGLKIDAGSDLLMRADVRAAPTRQNGGFPNRVTSSLQVDVTEGVRSVERKKTYKRERVSL